jgi:phosphate transport system permease protein
VSSATHSAAGTLGPGMPSADEQRAAAARRDLVRTLTSRSLSRRRLRSRLVVGLCVIAVALALAPLVTLVIFTVSRGIGALSVDFLTHVPTPPGIPGGGIGNEIVGTAILLLLAAAMAMPVGIAAALFLVERKGATANSLRFCADVLAGIPSIAIGIFAYSLLIEDHVVGFSAIAGSFALAVLMLPIIIRSSEAAMRSVPRDLWDAGLALGVRRSRVARSVVLRGALPGLVTGNLLAVARAVGETAPLLFTIGVSGFFAFSPAQPIGAIPFFIYTQATEPYAGAQRSAWGAAFVLLVLVLLLSIAARVVAGRLNRRAR